MNNFTKEQLLNIIAAADEVLTALAGTNEDMHRDDDAKMCAAWDNLNDKAAPPEVVKQLAQSALKLLSAPPAVMKVPDLQKIYSLYCTPTTGSMNALAHIEGELLRLNSGSVADE